MNLSWEQHFRTALQADEGAGLSRVRGGGLQRTIGYTDFGSNDYLGLRDHLAIRQCMAAAIESGDIAWGSGASSVLTGFTLAHAELEAALAQLCTTEAALVFSSGYACNVGSLACLANERDAIYSDQLNHASLIDGMRLSRATRIVFPHLDSDFLEAHLKANRHRFDRVVLITESVFSMDGDCADLRRINELAQRFDCGVVVDEAHATGVYGPTGGGLLEEYEMHRAEQTQIILKLGTLSKALGGIGGFAAGTDTTIDYLVNHCRSYLFSTAPPALTMLATVAAIASLRAMQPQRHSLRQQSEQFRRRLQSAGVNVPLGDSPIVPIIVGEEVEAIRLSRQLQDSGMYVPAIRPPTVAVGTSRLRVSLSTRHSAEEIDQLSDALITFLGK